MALPSTDDLKALCERTPMGPWAAISDYPYISIVMANDPDEIHAPIVDIVDSTTDEPEVEPTHELIALAPDMARELLRLRDGVQYIRGTCDLAYFFSTLLDTPEHKAVGANLKEVRNLLDHLLEGDTE